MKPTALRFLVCPTCRAGLDLAIEVERYGEIVAGTLTCGECGRRSPYFVNRLPVIEKLFAFVFPVSNHPNWRWRWLDTFDWYTPTYQWKYLYPEVYRWFRADGFLDIQLFDDAIRMRGIKTGG